MNTGWKIIEKDNIYNPKILKDLNIYENYGVKWIVLIDEKSSPNYYEKYNFYTCCFTGIQYRKFGSMQLEWSANCNIFVKCPNPYCDKWILYKWNNKEGILWNLNLINNFPNCCNSCNKKYELNPGLCCICKKFNFSRDQNSRGRDSYKLKNYIKITNKTGCSCSQNWFYKNNSDPEVRKKQAETLNKRREEDPDLNERLSSIWNKGLEKANEKSKWLRENDPEWVEWMNEINSKNLEKGREKLAWLWENDEKWAENQRKISKENVKIALEAFKILIKTDEEFARKNKERCAKMGREYGPTNIKIAREIKENLIKTDENYRIKNRQIAIENLEKAYEKNNWLWKNDEEWAENQRKICAENGKKTIHFALEAKIQNLKELFSENPIKLNGKSISFDDLAKLKKNDICGTWVLEARFKDYKGTIREKEIFKLGPFKSIKVYDEMDWARRVVTQPEKQDRWNIEWVIAKWWYFANLYYDFNLVLLTDENGVTEEEALIAEAAYASKYDLFVEFTTDEEGRRIPIIEKHAYWSP